MFPPPHNPRFSFVDSDLIAPECDGSTGDQGSVDAISDIEWSIHDAFLPHMAR
jgi:hypothetical protein